MSIIIHTGSMIPLYEQIAESVKRDIAAGSLREGDPLPSVRALAEELKISALTVKKAYDCLEDAGYTATVHGKGTYVTAGNAALLREDRLRAVEQTLVAAVERAKLYGITREEFSELLSVIWEA